MEKLSNWIIKNHCAYRLLNNNCEDTVKNRMCFIEKTPRVKIESNKQCKDNGIVIEEDCWLYGPEGSSDYGLDKDSRNWCDSMLKLLGYEL